MKAVLMMMQTTMPMLKVPAHHLRLPDVLMLQQWRQSPVTSLPSYPIHD